MKSLIVYDSWYGNTAKVAEAIADGLGSDVEVVKVDGDPYSYLEGCELLIVGSPTHGGVATPAIKEFLHGMAADELKGMAVSAFDTRATAKFVRLFGFAGNYIARRLHQKGGRLIVAPAGFYVTAKEGPLAAGEIERAEQWAVKLIKQAQAAAFV